MAFRGLEERGYTGPSQKGRDERKMKKPRQRWMPYMRPDKRRDLKVLEDFPSQQTHKKNRIKSVICVKKVEEDHNIQDLCKKEVPSPSIPKVFHALEGDTGPSQKGRDERKMKKPRQRWMPYQRPDKKPDSKVPKETIPCFSPRPVSAVSSQQAPKQNVKTGTISLKRKVEDGQDSKQHHKKLRKKNPPSSPSIPRGFHALEGRPYFQGPKLGQGGFGTVYAGIRIHDGLPVAIKYASKQLAKKVEDPKLGLIPLEVALMLRVSSPVACPNIVRLLDWFEQQDDYVMILERPDPCKDLGSFSRNVKNLDEEMAKNVMLQLVKALQHCEKSGVLHRDVKPANILFCTDTKQVKLLDFGCGDFHRDIYIKFAGTRLFAPPEWFRFGLYEARALTVWSLGVTMFRLLTGSMPFSTKEEITQNSLSMPDSISKECQDLLQWCLKRYPGDRPSFTEIERHPWFQ